MENTTTQDNATTHPAAGGDCVDRTVRQATDSRWDSFQYAFQQIYLAAISVCVLGASHSWTLTIGVYLPMAIWLRDYRCTSKPNSKLSNGGLANE